LPIVQETTWPQALSLIAQRIDKASFETWFSPVSALVEQDGSLTVSVPSKFFQDWFHAHYMDLIREALRDANGGEADFRVLVSDASRQGWEDSMNLAAASEPAAPAQPAAGFKPSTEIVKGVPLNARYLFDTFIIGNSNRFACAAGMAVAEAPSRSYNPLLVYGGVGLGKTHLLHAIGNYLRACRPELRVLYVSSEIFLNEMVRCLRDNRMDQFRGCVRAMDVLLVDDIQFMEGKEAMQQEFYSTFNALFEHSKQIVATSDRHPKDIQVSDKLRSRFEWGLTVDIQAPDLETRIAILKKKCELEHLSVPNDVLLLIAESMRSNIRDMEGSLTKVAAYASLSHSELNLGLARDVLKDVLQSPARVVSIDHIQAEVASHYHIKVSELRGKVRTSNIAFARQVAMYISRELTHASLTEIGEAFGGKNHSTVIHAIERVKEHMETNGTLVSQIDSLTHKISG
jgi:chromosomal replication initiator protein